MGASRILVSASLALVASAVSAVTMAQAEPRAVVELFTSQGCSSCPPADHVLGELAHDASVIALSLPIDYWDYLGWKDTLAKPRHSARQRGYARRRGDREVYTPQVVVNGTVHVLGSDMAAIERAITQPKRNAATLSVPVKLSLADNALTVNVPAASGTAASGGEIWACAVARSVPVTISRGENLGSTVTYHNVVRRWIKLGDWNGSAASYSLPATDLGADGVDAVAVIVQGGTVDDPGTMLGANLLALH
jgi:hypothetical protein